MHWSKPRESHARLGEASRESRETRRSFARQPSRSCETREMWRKYPTMHRKLAGTKTAGLLPICKSYRLGCLRIISIFVGVCTRKKSASCIVAREMNVLWFLMDFCQVSYRCGLLKVGKFEFQYYPGFPRCIRIV